MKRAGTGSRPCARIAVEFKEGVFMSIFDTLDKIKPLYDWIYKIMLVVCKILLIADILITSYAVLGRYVSFIQDPSWSEEIVLMLMTYMAVLSAALAIRRNAHIRMTAFDNFLPKPFIVLTDFVSDIAIVILAVIMIKIGWQYATGLGSKGFFTSIPTLSKKWQFYPIPLAGIVMLFFEIERIYNGIKRIATGESELTKGKEDKE
jgi:TRAP-type C4-dicarboxylate transport system permease small subunit